MHNNKITGYLNVEGLISSINAANTRLESGKTTTAKASAISGVMKNVKIGIFSKYLLPIFKNGNYDSLSDLHHKMVMISSMHFMDPYNFDLERVQRCVVHYATPDGKIIPFCTMNTLHRASTEKKFARPLDKKRNTPLYDVESLNKKILKEEALT